MYLEGDYTLSVGYYGVHQVYVCQMGKEGLPQVNYIFNPTDGSSNISPEDRTNAEQMIRAAMEVVEGEDVLLAPVQIFDETLKNTFHMTADQLFALPYEPPTLRNLGFFPDEVNAVWRFEQRGERDVNIEIHRPEWGEKEYDFLFYTALSDEYRIVMTNQDGEKKFVVGVDDNNQGGAKFEFDIETHEHIDGWCSNEDMTVEEYFINAFNDPGIEDVRLYSVLIMQQYIADTFGMTFDELYALPTGE
jgi:hypothetical protein